MLMPGGSGVVVGLHCASSISFTSFMILVLAVMRIPKSPCSRSHPSRKDGFFTSQSSQRCLSSSVKRSNPHSCGAVIMMSSQKLVAYTSSFEPTPRTHKHKSLSQRSNPIETIHDANVSSQFLGPSTRPYQLLLCDFYPLTKSEVRRNRIEVAPEVTCFVEVADQESGQHALTVSHRFDVFNAFNVFIVFNVLMS